MPLPLIPLVILAGSAAAGALGLKNARDAKKTYDKIENIKNYIERRDKETSKMFKQSVRGVEDAVKQTIPVIREVYDKKLPLLLQTLSLIKSLEYSLDNVNIECPSLDFKSLHKEVNELKEIVIGLGKSTLVGGASGVLASQGMVAIVTAFGTASTGTAISSLSGVAAKNAILAFLGGGSLAAGGGGMALGSIVLGSVAVAPALLVGSYMIKKSLEGTLEKLKQEKIKANKVFEERIQATRVFNKFRELIFDYRFFLNNLSDVLDKEITYLKDIISKYGISARDYPRYVLKHIVNIYKVIDISIKVAKISPVTKEGKINENFSKTLETYAKKIATLQHEVKIS